MVKGNTKSCLPKVWNAECNLCFAVKILRIFHPFSIRIGFNLEPLICQACARLGKGCDSRMAATVVQQDLCFIQPPSRFGSFEGALVAWE